MLTLKLMTALSNDKTKLCTSFSDKHHHQVLFPKLIIAGWHLGANLNHSFTPNF